MPTPLTDIKYTYAWHLIQWSDRLADRWHDTDFGRRLRTSVAIRLVEEEWRAVATSGCGCDWVLSLGEVTPGNTCRVDLCLERAHVAAWGRIDKIEMAAARVLTRENTRVCKLSSTARRTLRLSNTRRGPILHVCCHNKIKKAATRRYGH